MKAKLIIHGAFFGLVLMNEENSSYTSLEGETKETFIERIAADIVEDIDVEKEYTEKNFKSQKVEVLREKLEAATGLEADLISSVIAQKEGRYEAPDAEPDAEAPKAEKAAKAKKEPKAPKEPKEKKPPLTDEEKAECALNKGKLVTFVPHTGDDAVTGVINGLMHDKRVEKTYYRIYVGVGADKKMFHKEVRTEGLIIEDAPVAETPEADIEA